jgi:hypothetical protein
MSLRRVLRSIPLLREIVRRLSGQRVEAPLSRPFLGSGNYWEERYAREGNSGIGSYGKFAEFKAEVINNFVREHGIRSVIEFGCGDGNQLKLAQYPSYLGVDVSETVVSACQEVFRSDTSKSFKLVQAYRNERAELTLSLDVIFHLVEDEIFADYMARLFDSSKRYVIIYSSDTDDNTQYHGAHVRHRKFTNWVRAYRRDWSLLRTIPNRYPYRGDYREGSFSDFFIYQRRT